MKFPCAVKLNETSIFVAGGYYRRDYFRSAYILDWPTGRWTRLPDMANQRAHHACSLVGNEVVVTGGWENEDRDNLSYGEIFSLETNTWSAGPKVPTLSGYLFYITDAAAESEAGFRVFGGFDRVTTRLDTIFEYDALLDSWTVLDKTMSKGQTGAIAIPIPEDKDHC